jgi:Mce-associated membrane protein
LTERTGTSEPVRRRIGDEASRRFPAPTPPPAASEDQPAASEAAPAPDPGPGRNPRGRRRITMGVDPARNPASDRIPGAGDPAGGDPGTGGRLRGRRTIGDRPAAGGIAVADPAVDDAPAAGADPTVDGPTTVGEHTAVGATPADGAGTLTRVRRRRPDRAAVLAGAVIVVLLAAAIFFGLQWRNQSNLDSLRSSALRTGTSDGVLLSSYDYHNLTGPGSSFGKVLQNATPAFRKSFSSTSDSLDKLLTQYNATATGKVISSGLASFSPSRAVVLLFIDQTVNNSVQKSASATQPLRSEVTLLRQNGKWLIDNLQVPQ